MSNWVGAIRRAWRGLALYLFLGVSFFGLITALPGGIEPTKDDLAEGSMANVVVDMLMGVLAAGLLMTRGRAAYRLMTGAKLLLMFVGWCLVTALWADYPLIVLKRWIRLAILGLCSMAFVIEMADEKDAVRCLWNVCMGYVGATLLAVLLFPGAVDLEGNFIGWALTKNTLGQTVFITTLVGLAALQTSDRWPRRIASLLGLALSVFILYKSKSMTSILCTAMVVLIWAACRAGRRFKTTAYGRAIPVVFGMFACSAGVVILLMVPDLIEGSFGLIGKDLTFTDRVSLWDYLLSGIPDHLMQGVGYQGFWVAGSLKLSALFAQFPWMPNQAHNGYLDIVNETGLVGVSLFVLALAAYARRAWADEARGNLFQLILLGILIMNMTETTLLVRGQVSFTIFFIFYLWQFRPGQGDRAPAARRGFGSVRR